MALTYELQIALSKYPGTIDASTANYLLDYAKSPEDLRSIIDKIDTSTHGNITITYSGGLDGLNSGSVAPWSDEVAREFAKRPDLKVLDNTEAFKFLDVLEGDKGYCNNPKLYYKLGEIFGDIPDKRGSVSNQFLFGSSDAGGRVSDGAFDIISKNFAKNASGDVVALVPFASDKQVFGTDRRHNLL